MSRSSLAHEFVFIMCRLVCAVEMVIAMAHAQDIPARCLIEVREGGYRERQPHTPVIKVFSDGRIETLKGKRQVKPDDVVALVKRLEKVGAFALDQKTLAEEFSNSGEAPAGARGGSGVITLVLSREPDKITVWLNQPDNFKDSKAHSVKVFVEAWHMIRRFADPESAPARN